MAKVIGPLHSDRVSGSVSGLQYSEYRGMAVVKRKLRPVGRDRGVQPNNRAILSALARSWGYETEPNRALWDDYAATHPVPNGMGGTFQLDGSQMYLALNHQAVRMGTWASKKSTPPPTNLNVVVDVLTATALVPAGQVKLDWTVMGTGLVGDNIEVCMAGPFSSGGRRAVKAMLSYKVSTAGNVVTTTISNLLSNAYYWFSVRYVRADGLVSATQYVQSIVN
jgi:hypothetical protein